MPGDRAEPVKADSTEQSGAPPHPQIVDANPFFHAQRNYRNGRDRAQQDYELMRQASDADFVKQINKDCQVEPYLEWITFGGALLTKGAGKAFVVSQIGKDAGVAGKLAVPGGFLWGAVGAAYLTYELAEYFENSGKASQFEKRLLERDKPVAEPGVATDDSKPLIGQLPSVELLPEYVTGHIPSVRGLIDHSVVPLTLSLHKNLLGSEPVNQKEEMQKKALAHSYLTNEQFVAWAKQETNKTLKHQLTQDGIFGGVGTLGGLYTGSKLGFGRPGAIVLALLSASGAIALSRLKTAAEVNSDLANIYESRLLGK